MDKNKWLGKTILSPEHTKDLEREAAKNEFGSQLPREEAEAKAYHDYKTKHHEKAVIHHLRNLREAVSGGYRKEAEKHNAMYIMHMKALGHNPNLPPPQHIHMAAQNMVDYKGGKFTPHEADSLLTS